MSSSTDGLIVVDRHLEKNGGTSFREIFRMAETEGLCSYWGYSQKSVHWNEFLAATHNLTAKSIPPSIIGCRGQFVCVFLAPHHKSLFS